MADLVYNRFKLGVLQADYNLSNGGNTIKVALTGVAYSPDIDTHEDFADITDEFVGTGYTAGGETLANQATSQDNTNDQGVFDADNVTWTNLDTDTADAAVMFKSTGVASTSLLMFYIDSGGFPFTANGGDLTIIFSASGIYNLT